MGAIRGFITRNGLPDHYLQQASIWFDPIVETIVEHHLGAVKQGDAIEGDGIEGDARTQVIGINGCQGSGKTTLADYLCTSLQGRGLRAVAISIDDFYLTRKQRQQLATDVHPLLSTRGVPGTHDLELAIETLNNLASRQRGAVKVPRFNKAEDERLPEEEWPQVTTPLDIIILEGWCVGITAEAEEALLEPINELESLKDPDGEWRNYINQQLVTNYPELWQIIDRLIMLQAPSFSCVYQWRLEQEEKLQQQIALTAGSEVNNNRIMAPEELQQFIQHYERLTRHSLKYLPQNCQHLFQLTTKRQVVAYQTPNPLPDDPRYGLHEVTLAVKGESTL
jgi:D-glycerate 3-kinase